MTTRKANSQNPLFTAAASLGVTPQAEAKLKASYRDLSPLQHWGYTNDSDSVLTPISTSSTSEEMRALQAKLQNMRQQLEQQQQQQRRQALEHDTAMRELRGMVQAAENTA